MKHPVFVHLTDLHIGDPAAADPGLHSETSATLTSILAEVKRVRPAPDFIVVSGDLTNRGSVASFRALRLLFDAAGLDMPVLWALGNHDDRAGFYQGMLDRSDNLDAPYCHDAVIAGVHIITLDSSARFKVGGAIGPEQFAWLKTTLGTHGDLPKLIVVHHPPSLDEDDIEMEWEAISCADTIRLRETLAGHNVIGMLCGHIHYDRVSQWNGIPVVVGIGQHAATDVLHLPEGLRMVAGASFAIGTLRPSGLSISFVPMPSDRRELKRYSHDDMKALIASYEARRLAAVPASELAPEFAQVQG
jgi:3',5'-cyclic AMP phosphodiesterase CpdA